MLHLAVVYHVRVVDDTTDDTPRDATDTTEGGLMPTSGGLSVGDAAARLGISKDALRRRIDRKSIEATKADDGTWRVHLAEDPPTPDATTDATTDNTPRDTTPTTALLAEKDARIALLAEQLTIKDRQIQELHVIVQTAQQNERRLLNAGASVEMSKPPSVAPERPHEDDPPLKSASVVPGASQRAREASQHDPPRRSWLARLFGWE